MKLIANRYVQHEYGIIDLKEFKGAITSCKDASEYSHWIRLIPEVDYVIPFETREDLARFEEELMELVKEYNSVPDQDPLAPPKGYIDITRETSDGKSYRTILKISDVTRVVEGKPYTDIAVGDKIFHAKEDYDTVMSRMKEDC